MTWISQRKDMCLLRSARSAVEEIEFTLVKDSQCGGLERGVGGWNGGVLGTEGQACGQTREGVVELAMAP